MSEPIRVQAQRRRPREEPATLPGEGRRNFLVDHAIPGTVAGLIGGALMLALYMVGSSVFGTGPWDAPKMISSIFRRSADLSQLGPADVLLGLLIHFGVACTLAVVFAVVLAVFRYVSLGSIIGVALFPFLTLLIEPVPWQVTAGAFAAFLSTSSGLTVSVAGVLSQDLLARWGSGVNAFRAAINHTNIHRLHEGFFSGPDVGIRMFS